MTQPTPFELASLTVKVLEQHRDWTDSRALQWAYNLICDAQDCIHYNLTERPVPHDHTAKFASPEPFPAPVKPTEYIALQCPHCQTVLPHTPAIALKHLDVAICPNCQKPGLIILPGLTDLPTKPVVPEDPSPLPDQSPPPA